MLPVASPATILSKPIQTLPTRFLDPWPLSMRDVLAEPIDEFV